MKELIVMALFFATLIIMGSFSSCVRIEQNELGFQYDINSGKPVNSTNNPLLSFGFDLAVGINAKHFVVNSEVNSYNFTAAVDASSPYDESLSWDSREGVTMTVPFTILGRVTDPWEFYTHFGQKERDYSSVAGIQDQRIYEALRQAGEYVNVRMGELTQDKEADAIRKNPKYYADILTKNVAAYSEEFGFTVTQVIFPSRFEFPGGNVIEQARGMLRDANTSIEGGRKAKDKAKGQRDEAIANASIAANQIISEGTREASRLRTETDALANQFKTSIDQIGVEGTMTLKMVELQKKLTKSGVIKRAVLTSDSIFGAPFYVNGDSDKK
ncbi:hypothetical protein ACFL08_02855 [Patescibacteria group bacterium]